MVAIVVAVGRLVDFPLVGPVPWALLFGCSCIQSTPNCPDYVASFHLWQTTVADTMPRDMFVKLLVDHTQWSRYAAFCCPMATRAILPTAEKSWSFPYVLRPSSHPLHYVLRPSSHPLHSRHAIDIHGHNDPDPDSRPPCAPSTVGRLGTTSTFSSSPTCTATTAG